MSFKDYILNYFLSVIFFKGKIFFKLKLIKLIDYYYKYYIDDINY